MNDKKLKKNIFFSTIILFLLGTGFHFIYNLLNKAFIVGLIAPVNESVFEHLKLAIFPIFIWWTMFYLIKKDKYVIDKGRWFLGCFISIIISAITILSIYYFVNCGLGKSIIIVDILSLYVALFLGQFTGYHVYKYIKEIDFLIAIGLVTITLIMAIVLTINPPRLPLFEDENTHTYGIYEQ